MKGKSLRKEILKIINRDWPTHASSICSKLHIKTNVKNISKVSYHCKVLKKEGKINIKKIDRALVSWPYDVEKLRFIHDFMKE